MRLLFALLLALPTPLAAQDIAESVAVAEDGSRTLVHELIVPAPREAVWDAVATVDGWTTWAVPIARPIDATHFETTYDPDAAPGSDATIEQEWLVREAPSRAIFRTVRTPAGFPHAETYMQVINTFELEEAGPDATQVRLVASPYPPGDSGDMLLAFFRAGNAETLEKLRARFSAPASPPADQVAGSASTE